MTAVETPTQGGLSRQNLGLLYQYTIEAYKTFQKLAENLPNPMTAMVFKQFAADERLNRDLMEGKIAAGGGEQVRATLGADMIFSEILEGEMSYRESAEFLISRERTMERKLRELLGSAAVADRNLLIYIDSVKRAHIVELERELELIREDGDWWKREDAEWRIVHGPGPA
jgi:rubrerythrin